jgi:DNA-binding NtrC family response regulator
VVDDEKLIRWSLSERLSREGYQVASADSGEEALRQVSVAPVDVMLLDVRLTGIDGIETLKRALVQQPQMSVVMMSAHSTVEVAVEGMKHGAMDFLVKPFPFSTLDTVVKRAADAVTARRAVGVADCLGRGPHCPTGGCIVGNSSAMQQVREMVGRVAASDSTVLIEGESGVGKEVVARCIHSRSGRREGRFLSVNCAAVPEQLIESEIFGHERGAFTDARAQKAGIFEAAAGGSVMLDEVGDLPPAGQAKLLRLLEERSFRRVGGLDELKADVRVIAATNVDLERRVADGQFRTDLFFRLNVVRLKIPALRTRPDDVAQLAGLFVTRFNDQLKRNVRGVSAAALPMLESYPWPGNVRELRNVIERSFILHADMEEIRPEHLPSALREIGVPFSTAPASVPASQVVPLEAMERQLIVDALRKANGNQSLAARLLEVSRDTLRYRMKKHALEAN